MHTAALHNGAAVFILRSQYFPHDVKGMRTMTMTAKNETSNVKSVIPYKRVMLKMSGEVLMGGKEYGLDPDTVHRVACDIKEVGE